MCVGGSINKGQTVKERYETRSWKVFLCRFYELKLHLSVLCFGKSLKSFKQGPDLIVQFNRLLWLLLWVINLKGKRLEVGRSLEVVGLMGAEEGFIN